ncbi:M20 aminoacylase family protein [SAR92 clade bacterium H246]
MSMKLIPEIVAAQEELTAWRRDIHRHPELAFNENRTADFVATQLASYGIQVSRGVGKTGVVGTLTAGTSRDAIGLRADMDALPMDEANTFAHKSVINGAMHGCGHDGHTVMLLAAARYLAATRNFDGTVQFIFQPAEEANGIGSGARAMIEDGLFERFPMDTVFAMHNAPELALGTVATCAGAMAASMDQFDVTIKGQGTHGALPHTGIDPVIIAAQLVTAWQTIISRNINAQDSAVLSVTSILAGESWNVIPETVQIRGSVRTLSTASRKLICQRFTEQTEQMVKSFGAEVDIDYRKITPVMSNCAEQTEFACEVARRILGADNVFSTLPADLGSEDCAFLLQEKPGCYLCLGGADPTAMQNKSPDAVAKPTLADITCHSACMLHDPRYDFNDQMIPVGATLFVRLVERYLR